MKIKKKLLKYVAPMATKETRLIVARAGEPMSPEDIVTLLFVLSLDKEADVSKLAKETIETLPSRVLVVALSSDLDPAVISALVELYRAEESLLALASYNENTDDATLKRLAKDGPLSVVEIISNSERLRGNDALFEELKGNANILKPVLERAEVTFKSAKSPPAASATEPLPDLLTSEDDDDEEGMMEEVEDEKENIQKMIAKMGVPQKVKLAITGNKEVRSILLKERNKVVTRCVISNPRITEDEIIAIAASKTTSDETLRQISRNDEWLKNYQVKKGMVCNPKTPFAIASRLVPRLNEKDIKALGKSKNVPHLVAGLARRLGDRKRP